MLLVLLLVLLGLWLCLAHSSRRPSASLGASFGQSPRSSHRCCCRCRHGGCGSCLVDQRLEMLACGSETVGLGVETRNGVRHSGCFQNPSRMMEHSLGCSLDVPSLEPQSSDELKTGRVGQHARDVPQQDLRLALGNVDTHHSRPSVVHRERLNRGRKSGRRWYCR